MEQKNENTLGEISLIVRHISSVNLSDNLTLHSLSFVFLCSLHFANLRKVGLFYQRKQALHRMSLSLDIYFLRKYSHRPIIFYCWILLLPHSIPVGVYAQTRVACRLRQLGISAQKEREFERRRFLLKFTSSFRPLQKLIATRHTNYLIGK